MKRKRKVEAFEPTNAAEIKEALRGFKLITGTFMCAGVWYNKDEEEIAIDMCGEILFFRPIKTDDD